MLQCFSPVRTRSPDCADVHSKSNENETVEATYQGEQGYFTGKIFSRAKGVVFLGFIAWVIGLETVFSDNIWSDYELNGLNFFEWTATITDQFMLPLGGLLICLMVGFFIPTLDFEKDLNISKIFKN